MDRVILKYARRILLFIFLSAVSSTGLNAQAAADVTDVKDFIKKIKVLSELKDKFRTTEECKPGTENITHSKPSLAPALTCGLIKPTASSGAGQNAYTQTQAYLRSWFNIPAAQQHVDYDALAKKMVNSHYNHFFGSYYSNGLNKQHVLDKTKLILQREEEFADHYVFYHGYDSSLCVLFDLFQEVRKWVNINSDTNLLMRALHEKFDNYPDAETFLSYWESKPYWDNYDPGYIEHAISVNMFLFANTNCSSSCSYSYWLSDSSCCSPATKTLINDFLSALDFSTRLTSKIIKLYNKYMRHAGGHIVQFFLPKDLADDSAYLAIPGGHPYTSKLTSSYSYWKGRHTDITSVLDLIRSKPNNLSSYTIDDLQARMLVNPMIFQDSTKVKTFRYTAKPLDSNKEKAYKQALSEIVEELITEWVENNAHASTTNLFAYRAFGEITPIEKLMAQANFC